MKIEKWKKIREWWEKFPSREVFIHNPDKDIMTKWTTEDDRLKCWLQIQQAINDSDSNPVYIDYDIAKLSFPKQFMIAIVKNNKKPEVFDNPDLSDQIIFPNFWFLKGYVYILFSKISEFSLIEQKLLINEFFDKERKKWEQLNRLYGNDTVDSIKEQRERIPEKIRIAVWRRDDGKCARCGSREKLEYDHIIPFSKGGSNSIRNIELLCEKCNRQKSNNIE